VIDVLAYMYNHMSWGWGILMTLGWMILLGLFVAVLVSAMRDRGGSSARDVLDKRLAAGEISLEDYERTRAAITADPGSGAGAGGHGAVDQSCAGKPRPGGT
jgi:uncharacterized membrane protein